MRVEDRPVPSIAGSRPGPGSPWGTWPAQLFIGIERLPSAGFGWDDFTSTWDAAGDPYTWDAPATTATDRVDVTCWTQGFDIAVGSPDAEGRMDAGELALSLDNRSGLWSQYDASGRLIDFGPGGAVDVWAELDGDQWWLFSGQVETWRETVAGVVEIVAVDALARWNAGIGEWDPGTYGQAPAERLEAIAALIGYSGPARFADGDVTLHSYLSTATPLEEAQSVALSDGGVFGADADGTITYRDRTWTGGRADQTAVPVVSANVCGEGVDAVVWDLELVTDAELVVNTVTLANVAGVVVTAEDVDSAALYGTRPLARTADQWIGEIDGTALAVYLAGRRAGAYIHADGFTLYVHDPRQDLWRLGVDVRLGDLIRLLHDQPALDGPARIDLLLVVSALAHHVTPDGWVLEVTTTRAVGSTPVARWDSDLLDWDDTDPAAVWTY